MALLGCGSTADAPGVDAAAPPVTPGSYAGGCPSTAPTGGACAVEGRVCTYGDAPRIECRVQATCKSGQWSVTSTTCAAPAPASQCPATTPAMPTGCDTPDRVCRFPDGAECQCFANAALGPPKWTCNLPLTPAGACPPTPPNGGTHCAVSTLSCTYACGPLSARSVNAHCGEEGIWELALAPCAATGG